MERLATAITTACSPSGITSIRGIDGGGVDARTASSCLAVNVEVTLRNVREFNVCHRRIIDN
jgi:hypothetical protein